MANEVRVLVFLWLCASRFFYGEKMLIVFRQFKYNNSHQICNRL